MTVPAITLQQIYFPSLTDSFPLQTPQAKQQKSFNLTLCLIFLVTKDLFEGFFCMTGSRRREKRLRLSAHEGGLLTETDAASLRNISGLCQADSARIPPGTGTVQ